MDSLIPYQHAENLLGNPDRVAAVEWARDLTVSRDFVVFDSETTGLSSPVDFVEIAVVDPAGQTLFDSLLEPFTATAQRAYRALPASWRSILIFLKCSAEEGS